MTSVSNNNTPFSGVLENGSSVDWLQTMRQEGFSHYAGNGLPTVKDEDWKYTHLSSLADTDYRMTDEQDGQVSIGAIPTLLNDDQISGRLVFVNGALRRDLSSLAGIPAGVVFEDLQTSVAENPDWVSRHIGSMTDENVRSLTSLNMAGVNSGFVLHVPKGTVVEKPFEVIYASGASDKPVAFFPRNLIVLNDNAQANVVVHHASLGVGAYFSNSVSETWIDQGATLRFQNIQDDAHEATNLSAAYVHVGKDATFDHFGLSIGGRLSRYENYVSLLGSGAACFMNGAYLMRGSAHCDNTLRVDHLVPDTTSDEMFKGVLDDQSRAVFQGKVVVHRDAQRTDGKMMNKTMLLSDKAEIDSKPELEIYADDVKCSHGATSGQLDMTSLFYLRSRGIPEAQARNLLIQSFLGEAIERIKHDAVREAVLERAVNWLPASCHRQEDWRG